VEDYLVRMITRDARVRGLACITTRLVEEACLRHDTYPTASAALGRALSAGALMGALLKTGQRVALKFAGNGPIRKIIVEAESTGAVRGYVAEPHVELPLKEGKLDVSGALGLTGFLTVTKDLRLKELYGGTVRLYSGEIAEDLAYYLTESEQLPSAVGLGVYMEPTGISAAGGFLIQALPYSEQEVIDRLVEQIGKMGFVTELLRDGMGPEDLLEFLFEGIPCHTIEKRPLALRCSCRRERTEEALICLGKEELTSLANEKERTEVVCQFCGERYLFSREELKRLAKEVVH